MGLILALFAIFTFYIMATRPYRCQFSNLLVFLLCCTQLVNCFVLLLKISGLKSALFVDTYFYFLLILINGFGWFLALSLLLLSFALKQAWPVTKSLAKEAILGQELAIVYIKRARAFRKRVVRTKRYEEGERREHAVLLAQLSEEFNKLRDKEAICMDALLEIIDQMKEMKKNYEENIHLYNYNFTEELKGLVKGRERIYEIKEV